MLTHHHVLEIQLVRWSLGHRTSLLNPAERQVRTARPRYIYATVDISISQVPLAGQLTVRVKFVLANFRL